MLGRMPHALLLRVRASGWGALADGCGRVWMWCVWMWWCREVKAPPNLPALLGLLLEVHGYEVFALGCFNGDPHPGNILLMPDGRLGFHAHTHHRTQTQTPTPPITACVRACVYVRSDMRRET